MKVIPVFYVLLTYVVLSTLGLEEKKSDHRLIYESEDLIRQQDAEEGRNYTEFIKSASAQTSADGVDGNGIGENAIDYLSGPKIFPKYGDVNPAKPIDTVVVNVVEGIPEICSLPKRTGKCRGRMPRFFFNITSKECERFIYGGCDGNENRFLTLDECDKTCYLPPAL